ncbi:xanthine dehydrogenase accessory protein XdhC [Vibrio sp. SM6]|uniref:Xanthine dehydrogenase accessory protein XdhC n=1 Tax=Vibrio agarilyticus TaxID=2726741 RepID=A0A7X8TTP8_9VIBR|nr:xanthine dehydrogenase accessory protein XdhC [Vibrio agarilyticus]NLS14629.1 xanthine dehydrogenase accessory protein XdhC [Vibrio agarilyticus]
MLNDALTQSLGRHGELNWLNACHALSQTGEPYCLVTVLADVGSVPRARGTKMVITPQSQYDTLGGGNLEYQVIAQAREGLAQGNTTPQVERFSLAADLGQCCGGGVQVLFEFMQTHLPKVAIFGAGHVSQALITILSQLPCHISVIDNRPDWLERCNNQHNTMQPNNIQNGHIATHCVESPKTWVEQLAKESHVVVMTQDHQLDFEIVRLALERGDLPFIGLIGSAGKNQRFRFRLKEQLQAPERLDALTCPIGHPDIKGKLPMQVAVSIAAQLMSQFDALTTADATQEQALAQENERQWRHTSTLAKTLQTFSAAPQPQAKAIREEVK